MGEHKIFVIHGITDGTNIFAEFDVFAKLLKAKYKAITKQELDDKFELVPVVWDSATADGEGRIFQLCFGKLQPTDSALVSSVFNPVESAKSLANAFIRNPLWLLQSKWHPWRSWRYFATFLAGDIIAYVDEADNGIRSNVWKTLDELLPVVGGKIANFSIIGHSLGSVIAYDFLYSLL